VEDLVRANPGELTGKVAVYVSYSWTAEERVPVLEDLAAACRSEGLEFQRDTERLKHGDLIRTFMDEIGAAGNIVPVFSREYFQSEYCMYELLQVWKSGGFHQRIHPVRLGDIRLDDVDTQLEFIDYWRDKAADLRAKLIGRDAAVTIELQRRNIVYADIYRHINELMAFVSNMNILPLDSLRQDRLRPLLERINPFGKMVPNPTFAIRASGRANPMSFRGVDSQGRHYSEFAEAEFWTSPKRRIGGGGCWGKVSFSCCSSSCWSASGWV